ncbi:MAG: YafY family transcriptional regulator [Solirubrobacterales bacterium]|nr:YafY family transcriptional regulator [Solirubrobacterales bacterium]MBV9421583.1 YafY family transcriptional regulator [Solirubrobacterales bacterium]
MWDTSERLLRLLSLLQRRRDWNAEQLAEELEVTERTIRRDIARLRDLGYPVDTIHGLGGGYRLQAGATLPPLIFDTDEAVATLLALREHASKADPVTSDGALSALDKLTRVMPPRLTGTITALERHSSHLNLGTMIGAQTAPVAVAHLVLLARACREERRVTCTYQRHNGQSSTRQLEPLHLIHTMGNWYLVAYCLDARDWRTFRVDRITDPAITRHPSLQHDPPAADLHDYVTAQVAAGMQRVAAIVRVHAPHHKVTPWILPAWGTVTPENHSSCIVEVGADSYDAIARWLTLIGAHLTIIQPAELRDAFDRLSRSTARIAK